MRIAALLVAAGLTAGLAPAQSRPGTPVSVPAQSVPRPVGTMRELMAHVIRPTSDAVFYITSRTPETGEAWEALQTQTLALAESATVLALPAHARGRAKWLADTGLMREAARKAFVAAKAMDVAALDALNDELYQSCVTCHEHFRPGYGKRGGR